LKHNLKKADARQKSGATGGATNKPQGGEGNSMDMG